MEEIFICGHKNPDTDSIASAVSYAYLKSATDGGKFDYTPIRCGNANSQTKYIFEQAGLPLPVFMKDVYPKVSDCMTSEILTVHEKDPVSKFLKYVQQQGIRVAPVLDDNDNYKAIIGISEISELFIRDDRAAKPVFTLNSSTLKRSLKAAIIHEGDRAEFSASVVVATMPYEAYHSHVEHLQEHEIVLITGNRKNILAEAFQRNYPAIIIVGLKEEDYKSVDFGNYKGWVFASPFDSAQTIRCVEMATPVWKLMLKVDPLSPNDYLDTASEKLKETGAKSLPVVVDGKLAGVITSTDLLKRKRRKIILMDHNEMTQAVDGIEACDIVELIDHHRLGTIKTMSPVYFYAKPIGSTCTLVYQLFKSQGIPIPREYGMLLLGGILSDTVILKSPTATVEDHAAVAALQDICGVNAQEYGVALFSTSGGLSAKTPTQIVSGDFKVFEEFSHRIGISQVETVTLRELDGMLSNLADEIANVKKANGLDWMMLLVTDIIKEESVLVTSGFIAGENKLSYKRLSDNTFFLPGVLSRKKQLLPEVLRVLEELANS